MRGRVRLEKKYAPVEWRFFSVLTNMFKNKKGQFFLMFALVMIFFIALITYQYNEVWSAVEIENFDELNDNYAHEKNVVVNSQIAQGASPETIADELEEFGEDFSTYSREVDPNYGFYQVYYDPNTQMLYIQNFLSNGRMITLSGSSLTGEEVVELTIPSTTTTVTGHIYLNGFGDSMAIPVSTELVDFDDEYNQMQFDVTQMGPNDLVCVTMQNIASSEVCLTQQALLNGITTSLTTDDGNNIDVAVI